MIAPLLRSMRPEQWAKNAFVLAPLVFGGRLTDVTVLDQALLAFAAFCAVASAIYLINDIADREEDRRHPSKQNRPIAAGTLPVPVAGAAFAVLVALAAAAAFYLGAGFAVVLAIYLGLNLAYTFGLKHAVILDVLCISLGFVLRVEAGARATGITVSSWLLLCTIFLSLFLAFSKRRHEIVLLDESAAGQRKVLDHYSVAFLDPMIHVVTASSVVSYSLYAAAPETVAKFGTPGLISTVPMVLYGIFRYLYLMYQRPGTKNPTEAILTDVPFLLNILVWGVAVVSIVYGNRLWALLWSR